MEVVIGGVGTLGGKGRTQKQLQRHVGELKLTILRYAALLPENALRRGELNNWLRVENARIAGKRKTNRLPLPEITFPRRISILGIDPASNKDAAYAAYSFSFDEVEPTLLGFGVADVTPAALHTLFNRQEMQHPWVVLIESQYLSLNPKSYMRLVEARGLITGIGVASGHLVYDVAPVTWQSGLHISGKSEERKAKSLALAKLEVSDVLHSKLTEDTADAINIARYYLTQLQFYGITPDKLNNNIEKGRAK